MQITYHHEKVVDSTQDVARKLLKEGSFCPFVLDAERQTSGRGQGKNRWYSPNAGNLYATLGLRLPEIPVAQMASCSLIAALVIAEELHDRKVPARIKWPNDLLIGERKLAGILIETFEYEEQRAFLIGFGINVNCSESELSTLQKPAISLKIYDQRHWDKEELLQSLAVRMVKELVCWQQEGFAPFMTRYQKAFILQPGDTFWREGQQLLFLGIASDGALRVRTHAGEEIQLYSVER